MTEHLVLKMQDSILASQHNIEYSKLAASFFWSDLLQKTGGRQNRNLKQMQLNSNNETRTYRLGKLKMPSKSRIG